MSVSTARPAAGGTAPSAVPRRPRRTADWIPNQHGAWAMLVLPLTAGVWLPGPTWVHLPLALFWVVGYLAFHAAGRWLRSRHRSRQLVPLVVYGAVAAILGIVTLLAAPSLLWWTPAFLPLLALSLWWTARGAERSLRNDAVTVLAACLMAPVAFDAGAGVGTGAGVGSVDGWAGLWVAAGVLLAYLLGTVLYVKGTDRCGRWWSGWARSSRLPRSC
jgi:uncharacterized membrane protein YfcA